MSDAGGKGLPSEGIIRTNLGKPYLKFTEIYYASFIINYYALACIIMHVFIVINYLIINVQIII